MNIYIAVDYHGCLHWTHLQSIRDLWCGSGQMAAIVKVWADTMPVTISDCVDLAAPSKQQSASDYLRRDICSAHHIQINHLRRESRTIFTQFVSD